MEQFQQSPLILSDYSLKKIAFFQSAGQITETLKQLLPVPQDTLAQAMHYSVVNGGKRFRGCLVVEVAKLFNAIPDQAFRVAAACEIIHAYSLVHDDLPAMDDAPLRRGSPSCHKQYGESTAILVGDALIPLAYSWLSESKTHSNPLVRLSLIQELSEAIGCQGMVLGQMIDLGNEHVVRTLQDVYQLEHLKTGILIATCCKMGALIGNASPEEEESLFNYGCHIGRAFQIVDDILDALGDTKQMGKQSGKDQDKVTFIKLLGLKQARILAQESTEEAIKYLNPFENRADTLKEAAIYNLHRLS